MGMSLINIQKSTSFKRFSAKNLEAKQTIQKAGFDFLAFFSTNTILRIGSGNNVGDVVDVSDDGRQLCI